MTRVVAGSARGRRLAVPQRGTRPTSDRAREALFSALESAGSVAGARVLDLYAGSGALGIEAASRGAELVVLVENDAAAARICTANAAVVPGVRVEVVRADVARLLAAEPRVAGAPFDLVFLDPPYELGDAPLAAVLAAGGGNGWFAPGADLVVERGSGPSAFPWPEGFVAVRRRDYGGTVLWYGRRA